MEEENIYTHIEDTMSNIYLNGNMLNSGTVMMMLKEKDKEIHNLKELRKFEIKDKKELRENQLQEIIKLEKELAEKDKRIKELEEENENTSQLGFALYVDLLGKNEYVENMPSAIDQLVGKNSGKYTDMYNEYKSLKKKVKELEEQIQGMVGDQIDLLAQANKQLALYKKAFKIAKKDGLNMEDYLKEAKEKINE